MKLPLAVLLILVCLSLLLSGAQHPQSAQQPPPAPQTALDYFRRADDLTNIRMPGSPPFHMKVAFHASPGIDFAKPGQSTILTGDGVYEETWLAPHQWRREVTFGTYHAVEEQAYGIRKFQATSDYEPKRVLMLLRALLIPVPRYLIEPELQEEHAETRLAWKVKQRTVGGLSYVELAHRRDNGMSIDMMAYDLLPSGLPIRLTDRMGFTTGWERQTAFGGKAVPLHFSITALGRELLSADVAIASPSQDTALSQLPGDKAPACMTLYPFDQWDFPPYYLILPGPPPSLPQNTTYPADIEIMTALVVDRHGIPHEAETAGIQQDPGLLSAKEQQAIMTHARVMIEWSYLSRYHPGILDGSPCEALTELSGRSLAPIFSGGPR